MKTIPGIAVGAAVLVVATALITWLILHALGSCDNFVVYHNLDDGFYSLVIKERPFAKEKLPQLESLLIDLEKNADATQLAYCFSYHNGADWSRTYPPGKKCPIEDSPTNGAGQDYPNMSVLSHKIYSVRACDVEKVIDAIK